MRLRFMAPTLSGSSNWASGFDVRLWFVRIHRSMPLRRNSLNRIKFQQTNTREQLTKMSTSSSVLKARFPNTGDRSLRSGMKQELGLATSEKMLGRSV